MTSPIPPSLREHEALAKRVVDSGSPAMEFTFSSREEAHLFHEMFTLAIRYAHFNDRTGNWALSRVEFLKGGYERMLRNTLLIGTKPRLPAPKETTPSEEKILASDPPSADNHASWELDPEKPLF